ncbi:MAG: hypothetical protein RL094_763 [Candidatus Parcubacteria bacterium]|jgi:hypothetical protein
MADDKKKAGGKPAPKPAGSPGVEGELFFIALVGIAIIFIAFPTVLGFFGIHFGSSATWKNAWDSVSSFLSHLFSTVTYISVFACLVLGMIIFYTKFRLQETVDAYKKKMDVKAAAVPHKTFKNSDAGVPKFEGANPAIAQVALPVHPRWVHIEDNMKSTSSSDWRLAILEADIMLYDMLDQMGLQGPTIAEKLKQANPDTFLSLDNAWRAHKVRNIIAHEGASFELSRSQAEETIRLYKKVFDEFFFI